MRKIELNISQKTKGNLKKTKLLLRIVFMLHFIHLFINSTKFEIPIGNTRKILLSHFSENKQKKSRNSDFPKSSFDNFNRLSRNDWFNGNNMDRWGNGNKSEEPTEEPDNYNIALVVLESVMFYNTFPSINLKIYLRQLEKPINEKNIDIISSMVFNDDPNGKRKVSVLTRNETNNIKINLKLINNSQNINFEDSLTFSKIVENRVESLEFGKHINRWEYKMNDFNNKKRILERPKGTFSSFNVSFSFNSDFKIKEITSFDQLSDFELSIENGLENYNLTSFDVSNIIENTFFEAMKGDESKDAQVNEKEKEKEKEKEINFGGLDMFGGNAEDILKRLESDSKLEIIKSENDEGELNFDLNGEGILEAPDDENEIKSNISDSEKNDNENGEENKGKDDANKKDPKKKKEGSDWKKFVIVLIVLLIIVISLFLIKQYILDPKIAF